MRLRRRRRRRIRGRSGRCERVFLVLVRLYLCFFGRGRIVIECRWELVEGRFGEVELFVDRSG